MEHVGALQCSVLIRQERTTAGDESSLLAACRAGDERAFTELVRRYRARAVNLSYQMLHDADEAEDVAQEAFLQVFAQLRHFRGDAAFGTWLYRIVVNLCLARQRKSARRGEEVRDLEMNGAHETMAQAETKWTVEHVLRRLPEKLRGALVLRELHGLDYREIAEVLNVPIGTVRSRLNLARQAFIKEWEKLMRDEG